MALKDVDFKVGQLVTGEVYRILDYAVLVRFAGNNHGIIRRRELSWDEEYPIPAKYLTVGQSVQAIVLKVDQEGRSLELSLRLAQKDPLQDFLKRHKVGDVLRGVVRNVREFGAFVEIELGVDGFLPTSEIRLDERLKTAHDALMQGDEVIAVLQSTELSGLSHRLPRLSIKDYLRNIVKTIKKEKSSENGPQLQEFLTSSIRLKLRQRMGDIPEELTWPEPGRIQQVLLCDDHTGFRQSLAEMLREWGYAVMETDSIASAQEAAEKPIDLAIIDFFLSGGSTLDLAQHLINQHGYFPILLLSGFELTDEDISIARENRFLIDYKPFGPTALADYLRGLEVEISPVIPVPIVQGTPSVMPSRAENIASYGDIQEALEQLATDNNAKGAVIFRESIAHREIEWPYIWGIKLDDDSDTHTTLHYSPVGDVLRERRLLTIKDVADVPRRSKYLTKAISFRSCIGIPLEVPEQARQSALFLFSDEVAAFEGQSSDYWQWVEAALARLLSRHQIFSFLISRQDELLHSQLRAGALHDVRNSLGSLQFKLTLLMEQAKEFKSAGPIKEEVDRIRSLLFEVDAISQQMDHTLRLFRELGLSTEKEKSDVNSIIRRSVERQQPLASHLAVHLNFQPDHNLPATILRPEHLQQAVENVILNGIQWCAGQSLRQVKVSTIYKPEDHLFPIKIYVQDSGPGIHKYLQEEKIFEMGYSTRQDGSGLGLFVARALIQAMGGRVHVEESIVEIGTTFLLEIPLKSL